LRQRLTELADNRIVQYTSDGRYGLTPRWAANSATQSGH